MMIANRFEPRWMGVRVAQVGRSETERSGPKLVEWAERVECFQESPFF
jgi:hypothetical protein